MRKLSSALLLCLLTMAACQAQEQAPAPRLLCLARIMDAMLDMQVLGVMAPLQLTTQQLQALSAVYQQYPREEPTVASAEEAVKQLGQIRARMIAGKLNEFGPAEQQALQKAFSNAFGEFGPRQNPDAKVPALAPEEKLVWAILTDPQRSKLLGTGDSGNQAAAEKALQTISELRGKEAEGWAAARDKLAACLSTVAGPEGSPARDNSRSMFLDFLNRIRNMTEADFANKHKELVAELLALLPPGTNLAQIMGEFDPSPIHQVLQFTLLGARAPGIVQEMLAARTKKPE